MKNNFEIYNFYDTDDMGFEEYDITGKEYELLIKTCCKYCNVVSLIITNPKTEVVTKLEEFKIQKPDNITFEYTNYNIKAHINYYRICDEVCNILLNTTDSIFSWITGWGYENPDDPTFYREDGSVFFTSTIHDGECTLFIRDEDVSEILANKLWTKGTGHGNRYTVIPIDKKQIAENHHLTSVSNHEKVCFWDDEHLTIQESNGRLLNSDNISVYNDILFSLNFYCLNKKIQLMIDKKDSKGFYMIEFVDVIGFSMTSCDFSGHPEQILGFEYVEPSKRVIIPKLNKDLEKKSENFQGVCYKGFIETLITFYSGDQLRIACSNIIIPKKTGGGSFGTQRDGSVS